MVGPKLVSPDAGCLPYLEHRQDHYKEHDADAQRPVWASMRHVQAAYGLSPSTQRNLSRLGKIEMVRLIGTGGGKLVRVNLPSVDRYFASLPKVEPGTGRWLGPERNGGRSPKHRTKKERTKERHGDPIKTKAGRKKPLSSQ
jgi:hypothetical protein